VANGGAHGLARCLALSLALRLLASRVGRFTEDSLWHERMGVAGAGIGRGCEPAGRRGHNRRSGRTVCEQHKHGSVRGAAGDRGPYSMLPAQSCAGRRVKPETQGEQLASGFPLAAVGFQPAAAGRDGASRRWGRRVPARIRHEPIYFMRSLRSRQRPKRPFGRRLGDDRHLNHALQRRQPMLLSSCCFARVITVVFIIFEC